MRCHRAAGYDTSKPLDPKQTLICCHLYNAWRQLDKSIAAEDTNVSFAITPQDKRFTTTKAARMGFPAADSIDEAIRSHVEDELT